MFLPSVPLSDILPRGNNNFDALRTFAAASVVVSHAFLIVNGTTAAEPLWSMSAYTLGQHAVNVFFVLSGLLVAASLERSNGIANFAVARALRIFPGLTVCVLIVALLAGPLMTTLDMPSYFVSREIPEYAWKTLTLTTALAPLPGVFETLPMQGQVNAPLWSLKYEVLCYLVLALIAILGIWRKRVAFWAFFSALLVLQLVFEVGHSNADEHVTAHQVLRFSLCFFLGAAAYRLRGQLQLSAMGAIGAILLLIFTRDMKFNETIGYVAVGYLTLCLAALPLNRSRDFFARFDLSYGLYIYGWPTAQIALLCAPGISAEALAVVSLSITGVVAAASWVLIEKPALSLKNYVNTGLKLPAVQASAVAERSLVAARH